MDHDIAVIIVDNAIYCQMPQNDSLHPLQIPDATNDLFQRRRPSLPRRHMRWSHQKRTKGVRERRVSKTRLYNICIEKDEVNHRLLAGHSQSIPWVLSPVIMMIYSTYPPIRPFIQSSMTCPDISWVRSPLLSILHQWVISPGTSTVLVPWKPSCFDSAASSSSGTGVSGVIISCGVFTGPLDWVAAAPFASWVPS